MNDELILALYDLPEINKDIVSLEKFKTDLQNDSFREKFYSHLASTGKVDSNQVDYNKFTNDLGISTPQQEQLDERFTPVFRDVPDIKTPEENIALGIEPDPEKKELNNNPITNFFVKGWEMSKHVVPSMMAGLQTQRAVLQKNVAMLMQDTSDMTEEEIKEMERIANFMPVIDGVGHVGPSLQESLQKNIELTRKHQESIDGYVNRLGDINFGDGIIEGSLDFFSWMTGVVGEAIPQVGMAIATYGVGSLGQISNEVYSGAVMAKANQLGITPEEVIDEGLDHEAILSAAGFLGAGLEYFGAKGITKEVVKLLGKEGVRKSIKETGKESLKRRFARGAASIKEADFIEAGTELGQYLVETGASAIEAGTSFGEQFSWEEMINATAAGFVGSKGIRGIADSASGVVNEVIERNPPVRYTIEGKNVPREEYINYLQNTPAEQINDSNIYSKGDPEVKEMENQIFARASSEIEESESAGIATDTRTEQEVEADGNIEVEPTTPLEEVQEEDTGIYESFDDLLEQTTEEFSIGDTNTDITLALEVAGGETEQRTMAPSQARDFIRDANERLRKLKDCI